MSKRIFLTGGGTAGHIMPIIVLADILKKNARVKYLYIGSRSGPEKEISQRLNINFYGIFVGKRRNYFSLNNFFDLFKIFFGLIQTYFLFLKFKPNIIFSKGGYVAFPVLYWAKVFKIPVIIHESDIIMGKTNHWSASFAKKICLGFPLNYYHENLPREKLIYTGIPLRKEFFLESQVLPNQKPKILITGGSQGSAKINQLIAEIMPDLIKKYEIYHFCGQKDYELVKNNPLASGKNENYHLVTFTDDMAKYMSSADLIISRAGANTLAEISALDKPSILIPLPSAHLNHQAANAKIYAQKNAAVVVSEKSLTSSSLLSIINRLMEDTAIRRLLGHHAREFAREDAASEIIDILFKEENGK